MSMHHPAKGNTWFLLIIWKHFIQQKQRCYS